VVDGTISDQPQHLLVVARGIYRADDESIPRLDRQTTSVVHRVINPLVPTRRATATLAIDVSAANLALTDGFHPSGNDRVGVVISHERSLPRSRTCEIKEHRSAVMARSALSLDDQRQGVIF
jgi:hypothetical protein